ncbi:11601_t:CDS:2 [Funneliformis geosporum]|uniref:17165_t:CDS:1 n=1 Tax=Funneliformis geosporum TaxID=1117311 RepID=A0A9W4SRH1_9GLOM|nr:11601_t:CDS:2 [Funneliformis geosporum]CAI2178931.1 17165_t:CDS:2 [Funneliformis geosporum]
MFLQTRVPPIGLQITRFRLIKYPHNSIRYQTTQYFTRQKYETRKDKFFRSIPGTFASSYSVGTTTQHISNSSIIPYQLHQFDMQSSSLIYLDRMKYFLDTNNLEAITKDFIDLKQKNISPTLEIYHVLLQMCYKASDLNSALEIFAQIYNDATKHSSVTPTKETFKYLLDVVEISSDHDLSLYTINSIVNYQIPYIKSNAKIIGKVRKRLDVKIDLNTWNSIFRSLTTSHKLYSTNDLYYFEKLKGLAEFFLESNPDHHNFTEETWRLVIRTLGAYPGDCKTFNKILQQIKSQMIMTPSIYSELIWALSRKSSIDLAIDNLDELISQFSYIPSREPLYVLLSYYADLGKYQKTKYLIDKYSKYITIHEQAQSSTFSQQNWQFNFSTVLMNAYVQALREEVSFRIKNLEENNYLMVELMESKEINYKNDRLDYLTNVNFKKSSFYNSWIKLLNEVKLSNSKYHKDHFELMIRFHILSNQINHQEFPLNEALNLINEMRSDGVEPNFETFKILLETLADSPEYNSNEPNLIRVESALKIYNIMESSGYDMNDIKIYQTLLDSCITKNERSINKNFKPLRLKIKGKINHIKELMKIHKVKHNQKSMLTLLELYGYIHSFSEMRRVWFEVFLSGYHRNLNFYKIFIKASSQNVRESVYCLDVLRHQMSKEKPLVYPDLETFDLLLKCCIKSNDLITMEQIINEMKQCFPSSPSKEENWLIPILYTYLNTSELVYKGKNVVTHFFKCKELINFDFWKIVLQYFIDNEKESNTIQKLFDLYVDWSNEHHHNFKDNSSQKEPQSSSKEPILKFPISPLLNPDLEIIYLYLKHHIRTSSFLQTKNIFDKLFSYYPNNTILIFNNIDLLKEFVFLSLKHQQFEILDWFDKFILNRIKVNENNLKDMDDYRILRNWVINNLKQCDGKNNKEISIEVKVPEFVDMKWLERYEDLEVN